MVAEILKKPQDSSMETDSDVDDFIAENDQIFEYKVKREERILIRS